MLADRRSGAVYEGFMGNRLTVGVGVDLCKGSQSEADAVLRAGKADVPKEGGHHQVLVCGVRAEKEEDKRVKKRNVHI